MKDMYKDIIDGCREFTFFDLTYKTSSIIEKLLWITLGVLGVIWVINVISNLILVFEEGPSIISTEQSLYPNKMSRCVLCVEKFHFTVIK